MDPLSATASALTILGTLSVTAQIAIDINKSPKSLRDLQLEISYLEAITTTLHTLAQRRTFDSLPPDILSRPLRRLQDVQKSFNERFPKRANGGTTKAEFKRSIHRNQIRELKKEVGAIREEVNTTIMVTLLTVTANPHNSYTLERSSSFSPDHYIITGVMIEPLLAYSTLEVSQSADSRVQKHFLLFAQDERRWRKVIVTTTTTIKQYPGKSSLTYLLPGRHNALGTLHEALVRTLQSVQGQLCWPVNQIHVDFQGASLDTTNCNTSHMRISGLPQKPLPGYNKILDEIFRRGLTVFCESQVVVIQSSVMSWHVVSVGSQYYLELRAPYTDESTSSDELLVDKFWQDLQPLLATQGCPFVARFAGVILDDSRTALYGYLVELPGRSTLSRAFVAAEQTDTLIPWHRKEKWIRQLITAVKGAHQKGVVVGDLSSIRLWLNHNEDIVVGSFKRKSEDLQARPGNVPPEFRTGLKGPDTEAAPGYLLTFASDIFALGMSIWLICEQMRNTGGGRLCRRAPFTRHPTRCCTAPHSNPIELPPTSTRYQVPPYIEDMIRMCRREHQSERPPAVELLRMLPSNPDVIHCLTPISTLTKFDVMDEILNRTWCSECGKICFPDNYLCQTCTEFDVCSACYMGDVRCEYPDHEYARRVLENGKWAYYKLS